MSFPATTVLISYLASELLSMVCFVNQQGLRKEWNISTWNKSCMDNYETKRAKRCVAIHWKQIQYLTYLGKYFLLESHFPDWVLMLLLLSGILPTNVFVLWRLFVDLGLLQLRQSGGQSAIPVSKLHRTGWVMAMLYMQIRYYCQLVHALHFTACCNTKIKFSSV